MEKSRRLIIEFSPKLAIYVGPCKFHSQKFVCAIRSTKPLRKLLPLEPRRARDKFKAMVTPTQWRGVRCPQEGIETYFKKPK